MQNEPTAAKPSEAGAAVSSSDVSSGSSINRAGVESTVHDLTLSKAAIASESIQPIAHTTPIRERKEIFEWRAVLELRPAHKLRLKQYIAKKQGTEGQTVRCEQCGNLVKFADARIHHIDHNTRNNQLANLRVYCESCNNEEKAKWLSEVNKAYYARTTSLCNTKERENTTTTIGETEQTRLLKQAPLTTQLKIRYKQQTLDYLLQYVTKPMLIENVIADVEALTECSHQKAIEYVDSYCNSVHFSPFKKWIGSEEKWKGQTEGKHSIAEWIAPRTIEDGKKSSPAYAKALEEYKKRKEQAT